VRTYAARLTELHSVAGELDRSQVTAWIDCPPTAVPAPGQYLLAFSPAEPLTALGTALFRGEAFSSLEPAGRGFLAAPPFPTTWAPGVPLVVRGPLGHGFNLTGQRLALAALGETAVRLLPLAQQALQRGDAVTLFTDAPLPALPASIEIYPLESLPDATGWADCLGIDLPLEALPQLRGRLGLNKGVRLMCPAQALVYTPMPCGGLAECGACAVPAPSARRGAVPGGRAAGWLRYWLACQDGPVFDLNELEW
jgi:hypothetical protein